MNFLSLIVSATVALNSLGHIPIKPPSYLEKLSNSSNVKQLPSFLKTASSFIVRPVAPEQLEILKLDIKNFLLENIPTNPQYFQIYKFNTENPNNICSSTIDINTDEDINHWPEFTRAQYDHWESSSLSDANSLRELSKTDPKTQIKVAQNCISQANILIHQQPEKYKTLLKYLDLLDINGGIFLYAIGQKETGISDSEGNIILGAGTLPDAGNGNGLLQIISYFKPNNRHEYISYDSFIWPLVKNNIIFNIKSGATVLTVKLEEITDGDLSEDRLLQVSILTLLARYNAAEDPYGYANHVIAIYNRILATPTLPASYKEKYKPIPQI